MKSIRKIEKANIGEAVNRVDDEAYFRINNELTSSYRELDKLLVTVSSAVLGLSVPFASTVLAESQFALLAFFAWFAYAATVVAVMFSLRIEQSHKSMLLDTRNYTDTGVKTHSGRLDCANKISAWSFAAGTVLVAAFLLVTVIEQIVR